MTTPASSAYHRRRALKNPTTHIASFLETNPTTHCSPDSRPIEPRPAPSTSLWEPNSIRHAHIPRSNSPTLPDFRQLFLPLFSHAQSSVLLSIQISLFTLFIGKLLTRPILLLRYLTNCANHHHYYPTILNILSVFFLFVSALSLSAAHYLFNKSKASLLIWRVQTRPAMQQTLRVRALHAVASVSCAVVQTIATAYILYGPTLVSPILSPSKCASPYFLSQVFPDRSGMAPHAITGFCAGIAYSIFWTWSAAYASGSYPFHASARRRVLLYMPRAVLLALIPAVMGAIPGSVLHGVLSEEEMVPHVHFWAALVERLGHFLEGTICVFVTLLSWNMVAVVEEQLRNGGGISQRRVAEGNAMDGGRERERLVALVRKALVQMGQADEEQLVREIVTCLYRVTRTKQDLEEFPGFADASGEVWKVALDHCLAPVHFLHILLRDFNVRLYQKHDVGNSLFLGPARRVPVRNMLGSSETFVFGDADVCIAACEVLADVFVASYHLDAFGVVHRTLASAVQSLLKCKEQTESFLSLREGKGVREVEAMARLKNVMLLRSDYETVAAVDDAIMLAMYRIVETFRGYFSNFVKGSEVAWDRSLDRQLRAFLDYQVS